MVRYARRGCEAALAKGAGYLVAAVFAAVHVLDHINP
jgi:hypothetical protein